MNQDNPQVVRRFFQIVFQSFMAILRGAFIDLAQFPLGQRILAVLGYLSIAFLLVLTLVSPSLQGLMGVTQYTMKVAREIPTPIVLLVSMGYILSWTFLLSGAFNSGLRIFLPALVLFALSGAIQVVFAKNPLILCALILAGVMLVTGLLVFYLAGRRRASLRKYPLLEFGIILFVLFITQLFIWISVGIERLAILQEGTFSIFLFAIIIFWVIAGFTAVDLAIQWSRALAGFLARLFPLSLIPDIQAGLIFLHPVLSGTIMVTAYVANYHKLYTFGGIDCVISLLIALVALVFLLLRKWKLRTSTIFFTLSFASSVAALGFVQVDISNLVGTAVQSSALIPGNILFAFFLVYNILTFLPSYGMQETQTFPRSGRIPLLFGFALLTLTMMLFYSNLVDTATGLHSELDSLQYGSDIVFSTALLFLGPLYLGWSLWKHPERFQIKDNPSQPPVFLAEGEFSSKKYRVIVLVLTLSISFCVCCVCLAAAALNPAK